MRLYHPGLGREIDVPDDEDCISVHVEGGWKPVPETEPVPGLAPEPTRYEPVVDESPKKTTSKSTKADQAD
jgi:hypothetical protein